MAVRRGDAAVVLLLWRSSPSPGVEEDVVAILRASTDDEALVGVGLGSWDGSNGNRAGAILRSRSRGGIVVDDEEDALSIAAGTTVFMGSICYCGPSREELDVL